MAEPRFDELIHPSTRLSIVALLAAADWVDFAFVRDRLSLSDSALSKQFATLESAGYIVIERPIGEPAPPGPCPPHRYRAAGVRGTRRRASPDRGQRRRAGDPLIPPGVIV